MTKQIKLTVAQPEAPEAPYGFSWHSTVPLQDGVEVSAGAKIIVTGGWVHLYTPRPSLMAAINKLPTVERKKK
jgi:hypothetical protein